MSNSKNTTDLAWHNANPFYDLLHELQLDMLESRKRRDVNSMIDTFNDIYILVYPYIQKHIEDDKEFDNFDDIYNGLNKIISNNTKTAISKNNTTILESISKLNIKRKKLSILMAKAQIYLPLKKINEDLPSALDADD